MLKILTTWLFNPLLMWILILTQFLTIACISCNNEKYKEDKSEKNKKAIPSENITSDSISNINFYFENSGSMNGYLQGIDFINSMIRILGNTNGTHLNAFFVNTEVHSVENILDRIKNCRIEVGNIGSSDHKFIYTNAIVNATNNNLSIVVTDGIYSVIGNKPQIVSTEIELAFRGALEENEIETVILKLSSNFDGIYYSESNNSKTKINQKRPYYILLFGNKKVIDKALSEIVNVDILPGFQQKARFLISEKSNINYTVLMNKELILGNIEPIEIRAYEKREIKINSSSSKKQIQFGIAVDLSDYPLDNSYLTDTNNYKVDEETGYKVIGIKIVEDLKKSSETYRELDRLNNKYTHIIIVKASTRFIGDLKIVLQNDLPAWIKNTGTEDDSNIINNTNQTFAFDQLINGISQAYKIINNEDYFEIIIKTTP